MEAREFLNQKRIGLVNKFYYQVFEIKKNGADEFRTPFGSLLGHRGGNLLQFEVIADGLVVVVIDRIRSGSQF